MAVCSEIHTKHINTLCGQNVEFLGLNLINISKIVKAILMAVNVIRPLGYVMVTVMMK